MVLRETPNGWRVSFTNKEGRKFSLGGALFKTADEAFKLRETGAVFVWMKENKKRPLADRRLLKAHEDGGEI